MFFFFGRSLSETTRGTIVHRAIHGHSGTKIQPNFFSQQLLDTVCERASSHRAREVRDCHQRRRARSRRLRRTRRTMSSVPRACQHPRQNSYTQVQSIHVLESLTTTRSTLWTWRAGRKKTSSSTNPQRLFHLLQHNRQGVRQKCSSYQGQGRTCARIRGAVAYIPSKSSLVTGPWEMRENERCLTQMVFGKCTCQEETPCAIQKNNSTNKVAICPTQRGPGFPQGRKLRRGR